MFVTFEGLDGSGGTTQLALLRGALERQFPGREIVCTREPSDGPIGRFIRAELVAGGQLGDTVFPYLFAADRRDHLDRVVKPALARGAFVLSDRYFHSSLAYQSHAIGMAQVEALNAAFPAPDLVVLLQLSPERCMERMKDRPGKDRFETLDWLRKIEAAYEEVCRRKADHRIARIDSGGPREDVHARVWAALEAALAVGGAAVGGAAAGGAAAGSTVHARS